MTVTVVLGLFLVTSCDRSKGPDGAGGPSDGAGNSSLVVLRADPNPIPPSRTAGKTTITWTSGSEAAADVFVGPVGNERLFASGPEGSQEAAWIRPGTTEFRLYSNPDHKLLAELSVTMLPSGAPTSSPAPTP